MLIRHSILYMAAKLVPGLLGLLTTSILTRLLEPEQYGLYGLALVVMTFGSTMVFDWLGLAYLRFAQSGGDRRVAAATFVRIFLLLAALTLLLALAAYGLDLVGAAEIPVVGAGLVMMWCFSWFELVSRFHVADLRPGRYLRMNLGRAVLILLGAAGAAWFTRSPVWVAFGTAAGMLAGGCLGGAAWLRLGAFDRKLAAAALAFGLPLAASLTLSSLVNSGTRALLSALGSIEALGLYTAGFVLVQNTLAVAAAGIASAGYSLAVRAVDAGEPEAARRQLLANGALLLAVLAPMAVGMALAAPAIASTLVGPRYVDAVAALTPWMAAGGFFGGIRAHFLDHAFQLGHRPRAQIWVTASAAAVTLLLSVWLIPAWGAQGAAIAVTLGMAVACAHAMAAGRHAFALPIPWTTAWRVALACCAMAACVVLVPGTDTLTLVRQVLVGGTVYGLAALVLDILGVRARLVRETRARLAAPAAGGAR